MMRIIGIDGGGTKSVACLLTDAGALLAHTIGEPTNYSRSGEAEIVSRLAIIVQTLMRSAGLAGEQPDVLSACLSGLGQEWARQRIHALLEKRFGKSTVFVQSDAMAALHGAFCGRPGIILIAGTGSIAFAKDALGKIHRCGGWGYLLGDEGSGFDIGRNAIVAALKDLDGRGEATLLRQRLEAFFDVPRIDVAVPKIYAEYAGRGELAKFAPLVFDAAESGDRVAAGIIDAAAQSLAELVATLSQKFPGNKPVPVALMGNIFRQRRVLLEKMQDHWSRQGVVVRVADAEFPAEIGAALLALESQGTVLAPEALQRLRQECRSHGVLK